MLAVPGVEPWIAKLDTILHELYHVDPGGCGIRPILKPDGSVSPHAHSPSFFREVARMVRAYLDSGPAPETYDFLRYDFEELQTRYGGVVGTAFRGFPSFPQRYIEAASEQPDAEPNVRVERLKEHLGQVRYSADDLHVRQFGADYSRRLVRTGEHRAA